MPGSKQRHRRRGPRRLERSPRRHGHPVRDGRARQPDGHRQLRRRALLQQQKSVRFQPWSSRSRPPCGGSRRWWRWSCANGFFVAAEFSIVTVRKTRIDQLIAEGHRGARAVRRAVSAPDRYIAATQLGITMASLGLGWMAEPALASLFEPALAFLPAHLAAATAHSIAVAIAFAIITAVEIIFGELTPKWIALERAEATALLAGQAARTVHAGVLAVHPRWCTAPRRASSGCSAWPRRRSRAAWCTRKKS